MASTASVPENACYDGNHISLDLFHTELGFPKLPSPAPSSVLLPQQDRNNETLDNNTTEGGEGPTCSICLCPREKSFLLLPCGHATFCDACSTKVMAGLSAMERRCPTCRNPISGKVRVFQ
eukprot:14135.XXX_273973_274335_1 [CDS] Oithona nana genome sequencing.